MNHFVAGIGRCRFVSCWMGFSLTWHSDAWVIIPNCWHWFLTMPWNICSLLVLGVINWRHAWIPFAAMRPPQLWRRSQACSKPGHMQRVYLNSPCTTLATCTVDLKVPNLGSTLNTFKFMIFFTDPQRKQLIHQDGLQIVTNKYYDFENLTLPMSYGNH